VTVEILTPATRAEWLALRLNVIGASETAAVLGCHDYQTPLQVWARKTGRESDPEATPEMKRGTRLEALALDILAEERPTWTISPNVIGQGGVVHVDRAAHMSCTIDASAIDPAREGTGLVEAKSVHPRTFARWVDEGLPLHVALQVTQQAMLTRASWAVVAALVIDRGADLNIIEVPLLPALMDRIRTEVAAFWRCVETNTPPPVTPGRDLAVIKALALSAGKPAEPEIVLDAGDNALMDALASYTDASDEISALRSTMKVVEARQKAAEETIREKIGAHTLATAGDYEVVQKRIDRKAYEVRASSSLRLTVSRRNANMEAA
jgi:predicted phage-related endonuclease